MKSSVKNTTRHYGSRCRDYKVQQIYEESISGEMIFDRSRLFMRNILPQQGTTLLSVSVLQDVSDMPENLGYPRFDIAEDIEKYHAKYGPYTVDAFEAKFDKLFADKLFSPLSKVTSDTTAQFRKLHVLKTIFSAANNSILLIKEYSEQLLLDLYEDAFKYCDLFGADYLGTHLKGEDKKAETLFHIRRYIELVDDLFYEYPHLVFRIDASLIDRFLENASYKHLRHGLQQFWMDPLRARVLAKHYDLHFRDLWMKFMRNNFRLPDCLYLHIIDWLLFTKTNTFMGESILCLLMRTHSTTLEASDITLAHKFKQVTRHVSSLNGLFLDFINVEIFI